MKKFNSMNMTLFDSISAELKVSIEASFTRKTDDGGVRNLVYITDSSATSSGGYGVMNPSIFLVFAHKGEKPIDDKKIYTSFPHLYRIRNILNTLCSLISDPQAYVQTDSGLCVNPAYANPMAITNIGRGSKWISFGLSVIETGNNGVVDRRPGVRIEVSEAAGAPSILTEDELFTLHGIVSTLDLANIAVSLSLAYLDATTSGGGSTYSRPAAPTGTTPVRAETAPRFINNGGYRPAAAPTAATPQYSTAYNAPKRTVADAKPRYTAPATEATSTPIPDAVSDDDLPWSVTPPTGGSKLSPASVGEPSVSDIDFNDEDSIAKLFEEND